jgi:hypothetical protein
MPVFIQHVVIFQQFRLLVIVVVRAAVIVRKAVRATFVVRHAGLHFVDSLFQDLSVTLIIATSAFVKGDLFGKLAVLIILQITVKRQSISMVQDSLTML